jgi:adenylosuccinate lyase
MSYQSPFSLRYGSDEMRSLWSEAVKRRLWRRVWLAVAEAQAAAGLVTSEQVADIRNHLEDLDLPASAKQEAVIGHDLMAELKTFAAQCPLGGGILHWGLTSADVTDNADVVRQRAALELLLRRLRRLLGLLAGQIEATADLAVMGYTHLQAAEPTTLGYRLAGYAQDLLGQLEAMVRLRADLRGKGIKGAVGTGASLLQMLEGRSTTPEALEASVMQALGLEAYEVTGQVYPRTQDYRLLAVLAGLAASMHKFAFDLRLMQSPGIGVASEPFGPAQVGSSAMPFKRNPVIAERVCSLARLVPAFAQIAWQNAADSLLERTLDDSANRRTTLAEAFLTCDEMLISAHDLVEGLQVDRRQAALWLQVYGPFASLERLMTALTLAGADRHQMHEHLRQASMAAWQAVRDGQPNPLVEALCSDPVILKYLQPARVRALMQADGYIGFAPPRARQAAARLRKRLQLEQPEDPP